MVKHLDKLIRRKKRNTRKILVRRNESPRLSVFRSDRHIYAQIIDDNKRQTIAAASTVDKQLAKGKLKATGNITAATLVGKLLAERAKAKGVETVVFDRGAYLYHGRIKALADAARENGLKF